MSESDVASQLARTAGRVRRRLSALLRRAGTPLPLAAAMRHAALGGGKRIRPAMLLAVAEPPASAVALDAACALECMHCYSLAHDDLPCMDCADLRRGEPSCHKAHGEAMALLAGDCLHSLAFEIIAGSGLPPQAGLLLAKAGGAAGMGGGQCLDLQAQAGSIRALGRMHAMKTGALFDCAVQLGALCRHHASGGRRPAPPADKSLSRFASAFGRLFQIANDIKDSKADAAQSKSTFVTVLGEPAARRHAAAAHRQAKTALGGAHPMLGGIADFVFATIRPS